MIKKYLTTSNIVICVFFTFTIYGLIHVLFNPLGYILTLKTGTVTWQLHSLTFLCLNVLFLGYWFKIENTPIVLRFLLALDFCWIGFHNYDRIFLLIYVTYEWWFSTGLLFEFTLHLTTIYIIPISVLFFTKRICKTVFKRDYGIPHVSAKRLFLVLFINFVLILWLESTGFMPELVCYRYGVGSDPHNFTWFIGKAIGTLSWLIAVEPRLNLHNIKKLLTTFMNA